MIYEACELVAAHLRDGEFSLNALRAEVPMGPVDPPIDEIVVKHEFEIEYLPQNRIPESVYGAGPLVLVRRGDDVGEFSPPGNPELLDEDARLGMAILALFPRRVSRDLHEENRCSSALLRVIRRSIGHFLEHVPVTARNLRDVQLTGLLGGIRVLPAVTLISETDLMVGAVLLDWRVNDRWADIITD
jgi:hypothetical protein